MWFVLLIPATQGTVIIPHIDIPSSLGAFLFYVLMKLFTFLFTHVTKMFRKKMKKWSLTLLRHISYYKFVVRGFPINQNLFKRYPSRVVRHLCLTTRHRSWNRTSIYLSVFLLLLIKSFFYYDQLEVWPFYKHIFWLY